MSKPLSTIALVMVLAISMASAADIPKYCTDEIINISKGKNFDMQEFISSLPAAVAKAKLLAKAPFGKPKDSDKTDIGMTFGCLKAFPENPGQITALLKDVGQKLAVSAMSNDLYEDDEDEDEQETPQRQYQSQKNMQQGKSPKRAQPKYDCDCDCDCEECQRSRAENFTAGERWGTWALNTIIPGLGSATIMDDYAGMGIQMGLVALGVISIVGFGWEEESYCNYWYNGYGMYPMCSNSVYETNFLYIGIGLLAIDFIFNIARSNSYNESIKRYRYGSNEYSGFNLAVLPNRRGEIMPYLMYNKTF